METTTKEYVTGPSVRKNENQKIFKFPLKVCLSDFAQCFVLRVEPLPAFYPIESNQVNCEYICYSPT